MATEQSSIEVAHEYVKDFVQPFVERGDTLTKFCQYPRVTTCAWLWTIQIGGEVYFAGRKHTIQPAQLAVKMLNKEPCLYVFEVSHLFAELQAPLLSMPLAQLGLWETP